MANIVTISVTVDSDNHLETLNLLKKIQELVKPRMELDEFVNRYALMVTCDDDFSELLPFAAKMN